MKLFKFCSWLLIIPTFLFTVDAQHQASLDSFLDESPYPMSELITGFEMDTSRISIGHGDNWAITWGSDDLQYSFFTDGKGFGLHSDDVSISPVVIEGYPPKIKGYDIPSDSGTLSFDEGGNNSAKVCGLVMIQHILYAWVRNINPEGQPKGTGSRLMFSKDQGKSWEWVEWIWPNIGYPTWLNAGKNYAEAKDGYAYFISPDGPSAYYDYEDMLMARVKTEQILDKAAYRFYGGIDASGEAIWDIYENRKSVFTNPDGCFRPDIVYNPGIDRYFLSIASPYGEWYWWASENSKRVPHMGIFESQNPWGPWSTVAYQKEWGKPENRFSPHIPSKWISKDGLTFYLLYSCIPNGPYQFNIQKCTIKSKK